MLNLVILKWRHFEHKAKFEKKRPLFLRSKKGIFDCAKNVLKIYSSIVIENFKSVLLCPIKWRPLNFFAELHKSPLLIVSIVKSTVSGLRQFLATENPWKIL